MKSATAAVDINKSISDKFAVTCSFISSADSISILLTLSGVSKVTGPEIKVTIADSSTAALASEKPIFPELLLEMYLTGSIFSLVGPAVMSTFLPANNPEENSFATSSIISLGSDILPGPTSPQA